MSDFATWDCTIPKYVPHDKGTYLLQRHTNHEEAEFEATGMDNKAMPGRRHVIIQNCQTARNNAGIRQGVASLIPIGALLSFQV